MKLLVLIRHVKSDWSMTHRDFDRPIRADRIADAERIACAIREKEAIPQHIICSPTARTVDTARVVCSKWNRAMETVVVDKTLYECMPVDILNCAKKAADAYDTLCIIGHNPSITDFVNDYTNTFLIHVPTSGAVCVAFDVRSWAEIPKVKGRVEWTLKPKEVTTVCP